MKKNNVWFLGGLSGGHLYPLLSIAKNELLKDKNQKQCFFIPANELIEKIIQSQQDITLAVRVLYYPKPFRSWRIIIFLLYSIFIFFKVFYMCCLDSPEKIYSSGGYFSIPFAICSWVFSIPFYIYHLDTAPGLAGKLIGIFPNVKQCIVYEEAKQYLYKKNNIIVVNYPIRYTIHDKKDQKASKLLLDKAGKYIVFILGGSQGSEEINEYVLSALNMIKDKNIYVIHQTGKKQKEVVIKIYQKYNIDSFVFDYSDDILLYYNASDLIISRAGAGTLAEINFFNKNALIIPLQGVALDHQVKNAFYYTKINDLIRVILDKESFIIHINKYIL
jgi:UDP-N-acetylglucosamine--N-acetylmuramyl-(pentapeptide) pyrophosphoryl-undecaprenol N-acetylglucosamine transferase